MNIEAEKENGSIQTGHWPREKKRKESKALK
jgi:hypothetical protein